MSIPIVQRLIISWTTESLRLPGVMHFLEMGLQLARFLIIISPKIK